MAEMKLKRLYGENTAGFTGNVLGEADINEIMDILLNVNDFNTGDFGSATGTIIANGNGTSLKVTTTDANGNITALSLYRTLRTKATPLLPDSTNTVYSNAFLSGKTTDSAAGGYAVYKEDGTLLDSTTYTIGAGGKVTFSTAQTFKFLTIQNLKYDERTDISIVRDANGGIQSFSTTQA